MMCHPHLLLTSTGVLSGREAMSRSKVSAVRAGLIQPREPPGGSRPFIFAGTFGKPFEGFSGPQARQQGFRRLLDLIVILVQGGEENVSGLPQIRRFKPVLDQIVVGFQFFVGRIRNLDGCAVKAVPSA